MPKRKKKDSRVGGGACATGGPESMALNNLNLLENSLKWSRLPFPAIIIISGCATNNRYNGMNIS